MAPFLPRAKDVAKTLILFGTGLAIMVLVGALLFAWSGVYNVAASRGHFAFTRWFLEFGMRNSVEFHASAIEAPPLDDPALFERGARHFQGGCAPCHGATHVPPSAVAQQMLPAPPDLARSVSKWRPRELFWITKHGLKYTGMPAWPAANREDEVWAVVAFLVRLPQLDAEEYRRVALNNRSTSETAHGLAVVGLAAGDPVACARCHGDDGQGGEAGGIPRIAGQKVEYLAMTMSDFAQGIRPSGMMGPVASFLSEKERRTLSDYYAALPTDGPRPDRARADSDLLALGAGIATGGVPPIPACESCHGPNGTAEGKDPRFPALAGQHAAYLEQQLKLWRAKARGGRLGEIMSAAVAKITDEQIRAVSLYYARAGE